ncbi:dTDP-4-dehydrorhamnose reductase [Pelomonas aquatica]|jgi:dTDP-4-dehydrorhamnose reductase|uniref:dTDP-4-dehydrorhamnose reductase n=1 Tax=Pelomonas aquatica TaxID=431058 RepID=A0A9X4LCN1_9BURK|nr:dTDP-4-dehydrorhamnose reductase [Pelomonas aquatica]MCY4753344.1 dTDP-4-dehydrorhamnose reductase [Pelomonas aquatica]MDG0861421.1 dTDP-4-dehydrorhamnose reductase [Pelomonas aquatica]
MKILLLGKGGQVGWELQRSLAVAGDVVALDFDDGADFTQPDQLLSRVQALAPQVIVNAAAHTAVDKAESEPELARRINAATPALLAIEAKRLGALFVHYSTDYVFDGSGSQPRDEEAPVAPLSVYGSTKAEGEDAVRASGCQHLILRTSWVYAARGGNFAKTMLRLAAERDQLKVIADQIGAPTGADLLADLTTHMLRAARVNPALTGTYHAVAGGEVSWHDYARFVIEFARARGVAIKVAPEQILGIPTSDYPTPARRPLNSRLSTAKLQQRFGLRLPHWQQGVERMLNEIL